MVVIGAGIAGLTTARVLAEGGRTVLVVEARERLGGRIMTLHEGDEVIELGAEFLHGRAPELWDLIREAGLATYERTGEFLEQASGELGTRRAEDSDMLEGLETYAGPDCSFAEYVRSQPVSEAVRQRETAYVEGFNAADAREASVLALGRQQRAEDEIEGERSWRLSGGYAGLIDYQSGRVAGAGGAIRLGQAVEAVERAEDGLTVRCRSGQVFAAAKVVVTLPLGVLQARAVRFVPEPELLLAAADRMRMGDAVRITTVFRQRIWPAAMSFLLARQGTPGVWWSAHPMESLTLTGWVGGPRTAELRGLEAGELHRRVALALAAALAVEVETVEAEMTNLYTHDWRGDEFSRGAYSWVPVGGLEASAQMCVPVDGRLFFAGEHTDTTGHWGTVHAALRSGLRAAAQVLAC